MTFQWGIVTYLLHLFPSGAGGVLVVVPSMAAGVVEREVTVTSPTSSLVKAFTHTIDNIINSNTDHR